MTIEYNLISGVPDFRDLPWGANLREWSEITNRFVKVECGLSRHPIVFVNYDGTIYAVKELPARIAQKEFDNLIEINKLRLPTVRPTGYVFNNTDGRGSGWLITFYLESSIPYRSLFLRSSLDRYKNYVLDAMAGLLVQLHLNGVYWGDCSLSNTLFRRDAGTLQAYLVDAETVELHQNRLRPTERLHDINIMQENMLSEFSDIRMSPFNEQIPVSEIGDYIRKRYQDLWEEINREIVIIPEEHYRIQDRIASLNQLGFSIKDVEILRDKTGDKLRLRFNVTDRNFHRYKLLELTGIEAEEMQARQMMNEIQQVKAFLSVSSEKYSPLSVAAHLWLTTLYEPVITTLRPHLKIGDPDIAINDPSELYCQVLEHKWFLSETAQHDIGHQAAVDDYVKRFLT